MAKGSRGSGTARGAFARFLIRRALLAILVVLGVVVITFFLSHVVPGDPAYLVAGPHATQQQIAQIRAQLHLNDLVPVQFWYYFTGLLQGNLGKSLSTGNPVLVDIEQKLPATLELITASFLLSILVGIPLGIVAGVHQGKWPDSLTRILAVGGVSLPSFWVAVVLQIVFSGTLHLVPLQGRFTDGIQISSPMHTITGFLTIDSLLQGNLVRFSDALVHLVLPSLVLAFYPIGLVARMVRTMMVEVLGENYIRTAKAYGLPARLVYYRYALRNAIAPSLVALGLSFAYELTGAFLVEYIFVWQGIGQYAFNAVLVSDYPAILGTTIVVAIMYVAVNLVVDIIQSVLDPRVTLDRQGA